MGYFIITDSNWARLRNEILSLAETWKSHTNLTHPVKVF